MYSPAYKRYALLVLAAVYTLSLVDRTLITLLLQPIKMELHLSDTQLGFITGIAFGLFYAVFGIPFGRWSDKSNRVKIAAIAMALWAVTVMSCLFVTTFAQLAVARILAGIGEAGGRAPTYSLVGDYYPEPVPRTRALTIYFAGGPFSAVLGYFVGGWLYQFVGWRETLFIVGLPGLVLSLLVIASVREPRSGEQFVARDTGPTNTLRDVVGTIWASPSLRHLTIALTALFIMGQGLFPWYAVFMMRNHGLSTGELGLWFGLIIGLGGTAGVLIGGYFATRYFPNNESAQMRMAAISVMLLVPCLLTFLLVDSAAISLIALCPYMVLLSIFQGPSYTLIQRLVPDDMRATAMAVILLLMNLIGYAIGPELVGILSDLFAPHLGNESLRYAMLATSVIAVWSGYHFWKVGGAVNSDLNRIGSLSLSATLQ